MLPCGEDRPHVRRQDDLRWNAGGGNLSNFINFLWMDLLHTFHFLFPHFMVLTDSIVMFHPDFQGDLLRLCKRNKPSHGWYYGLYCRKGLKSNSNCNYHLCIISIHPNLPNEWPFFHAFLNLRIISILPKCFLIPQVPVCEPVTSQKCAATSYTRCEEVILSCHQSFVKKRGCCNDPPPLYKSNFAKLVGQMWGREGAKQILNLSNR